MERKQLGGVSYAVHENLLLDTVPFALAESWLESAPKADTLVLCGPNPYPKTVKLFLEKRGGRVYAPHYTAYTLEGILGKGLPLTLIREKKVLSGLSFQVVTRPGGGSFLEASMAGESVYSGLAENTPIVPRSFDTPTVVIPYVSGCDYTETVAEEIARGIREVGGLDALLLDLAAMDPRNAIPALLGSAGILIGTPTLDGDAAEKVWELLTHLPRSASRGKFASAFGAYTWNGDAVPHVLERLRQLGMDVIDGGYTVQFRPDAAALKASYEYGWHYACKLLGIPNTHESGLVKCLVCGEIFDAALGVCPVCGVGLDKCVPVEEEAVGIKRDTDRNYLIIGGGTAALNAAEAIRRRDATGTIRMISREPEAPINRPMLSKDMVLAARVEGSLSIKDPQWYEEKGIELTLNTALVSFDPAAKTALFSDGSTLPYDRLILATGAECFLPPIPGIRREGVVSIRHLGDVKKIWEKRGKLKKAVVIGGGVLGLEAASELKKMRLDVTVLELAPRIMARQLDDATGDALMAAALAFGVPIHTGVSITEITGDEDVTGVTLADGRRFDADLVVISCGNRANTEAAEAAGVLVPRAIQVSSRMETNLPDVYACGDCAQVDGVNLQLWAEASEQGRVAGANAAGDPVRYLPRILGTSFEGMNTRLFAIGDLGKGQGDYKLVEYRDGVDGSFRRFWFQSGKITGGVLFGDTEKVPELTGAVERKKRYIELKGQLL